MHADPNEAGLVLEAEHVDEQEQHDDFSHVPGRIVRLTLRGEATYAPLLGAVARDTGIDYSILAGRTAKLTRFTDARSLRGWQSEPRDPLCRLATLSV